MRGSRDRQPRQDRRHRVGRNAQRGRRQTFSGLSSCPETAEHAGDSSQEAPGRLGTTQADFRTQRPENAAHSRTGQRTEPIRRTSASPPSRTSLLARAGAHAHARAEQPKSVHWLLPGNEENILAWPYAPACQVKTHYWICSVQVHLRTGRAWKSITDDR